MKAAWITVAALGVAASYGGASPPTMVASAMQTGTFVRSACVDSEGATTGFFCAPRTMRGGPVRACAESRRGGAACHAATAQSYCISRSFRTASSYQVDRRGNLTELVCSRPAVMVGTLPAPAPVPAPVATAEWQPMFNANLMGYDRREFVLRRGEDWRRCRAACDADSGCQAWTVSNENNTCYLKWDGNPELVSYNACCTTGLKGMESGGPAFLRARLRGGG